MKGGGRRKEGRQRRWKTHLRGGSGVASAWWRGGVGVAYGGVGWYLACQARNMADVIMVYWFPSPPSRKTDFMSL